MKDRTSSFRKSTLKSTRDDPLRSRIFPWVISPVGRYLMHFYRFIYSSSTSSPRASLFSPRPGHPGSNNPHSPLSPCLLFRPPLPRPRPLFPAPLPFSVRTFLRAPPSRPLVYFYSFPPPVSTFHSVLSSSVETKWKASPVGIHKRMNKRRLKGHKKACTRIHTHTHIPIQEKKRERYIYIHIYKCASAQSSQESGRICTFVSTYWREQIKIRNRGSTK